MKSVFVREVGELKERELDAVHSDRKMEKLFFFFFCRSTCVCANEAV